MAECLLPKQKVGGSNPLSRSILLPAPVPSSKHRVILRHCRRISRLSLTNNGSHHPRLFGYAQSDTSVSALRRHGMGGVETRPFGGWAWTIRIGQMAALRHTAHRPQTPCRGRFQTGPSRTRNSHKNSAA